jgi:hypothetical protein
LSPSVTIASCAPVSSIVILDLLPLAFYFNSWEIFDQIVTMLLKTLVVLKESKKVIYFANKLFKLYTGEARIQNLGAVCELLGEFFFQRSDYTHSQLFYLTSLQYTIILNDIEVR